MKEPNFLQCFTVEEANKVDLKKYRFERFSETRSAWLFVKRCKK